MTGDNYIETYLEELKEVLAEHADPEKAEKMEDYMQNNFKFFGIQATPRRKLTRKLLRQENRPDYEQLPAVIKELWELPEREFQYVGWELVERYTNHFTLGIIELLEYMIVNKSWWDTVDMIAKKLVGEYFKQFPDQKENYIDKWLMSDNIWLQRTAILFQLGYKEETDVELLFAVIEKLQDSEEFFIQKAIGWALREYSKLEPELIKDFIANHDLSSLSEREGLKAINKN
jgi:3-methyladenine DNA glycosylase AlkD